MISWAKKDVQKYNDNKYNIKKILKIEDLHH